MFVRSKQYCKYFAKKKILSLSRIQWTTWKRPFKIVLKLLACYISWKLQVKTCCLYLVKIANWSRLSGRDCMKVVFEFHCSATFPCIKIPPKTIWSICVTFLWLLNKSVEHICRRRNSLPQLKINLFHSQTLQIQLAQHLWRNVAFGQVNLMDVKTCQKTLPQAQQTQGLSALTKVTGQNSQPNFAQVRLSTSIEELFSSARMTSVKSQQKEWLS